MYFDKTPREMVLEIENSRLLSENKYLRQSLPVYSNLVEPETIVIPNARETLNLQCSVGVVADSYGLHVYVTDQRPNGKHEKISYYCSASQIMNSSSRSHVMASMHEKLLFELGSKHWSE